jgi:hypothetical protein
MLEADRQDVCQGSRSLFGEWGRPLLEVGKACLNCQPKQEWTDR